MTRSSLFPIDDDVYQNILQDMNNTGFNPLFHIVLTSFRGKNSVLLDGHTRLKAAKEQKYPRVPVIYEYFYNPEEVVQFALALQISTRRNTSDYQIATTVRALLNDGSGVVNREKLFEQFSRSVSRRKLDRAIQIAKYAIQEEWEMLKNGATFNAVQEHIQKGNAPLTPAPAAVVTSTAKQTETTRTGDEIKVTTIGSYLEKYGTAKGAEMYLKEHYQGKYAVDKDGEKCCFLALATTRLHIR